MSDSVKTDDTILEAFGAGILAEFDRHNGAQETEDDAIRAAREINDKNKEADK